MRNLALRCLLVLAAASLLLSACSPAPAQPTPTPGSGGSPDSGAESGAGADSSGGGAPATGTDTTTGLVPAARAPIPSGAVAPAPATNLAHGSAMLVINGDVPIIYSGGDCDIYGEEMFLSIYPGANPGASFILSPATRTATMVWARSGLPEDNAAVSATDPLIVTLNEDGFSGSFEGNGFRVGGSGEPVAVPISISGSFTCISQLVRVGGDHPVDMTGVSCEASPSFTLRAGSAGGNAVLLETEIGASAGTTVVGGISWRVGGTAYTSNWLSVRINTDGVSGSYYGEGSNPDGSTFIIQGSFNCLGS